MNYAAIIVASGSSRRMGFDKLGDTTLSGKPVLWHSVRAFSAMEEITQVIVVTPPERFTWLGDLKKLTRVDGGNERSDSVATGLAALHQEITHVAIHDGARPCISAKSIRAAFSAAEISGAAALARRVTETLKRATPDGITTESVSRDDLWIMETPQIFAKDLIQKAYQNVQQGDAQITDEVSALQLLGQGTTLVENLSPNPKITVQADLDSLS